MEKIRTHIQLFKDDVELNMTVNEDLTAIEGNLKNWGFIEITDGHLETESLFWDNIDFFLSCGKKEFKEECKEELIKAGYNWREIYKTIKQLLKRAKKLKIIVE
jgi:hypothetical protein